MTDNDERLAAVLGEHQMQEYDPACSCGWDWDVSEVILPSAVDFDSTRYRLSPDVRPPQHRAHVAAVLRADGWVHRSEVAGAREYVHDAIDPPNQFITYYDLVDTALAAVTEHLGGDA